MYSGLFGSGSGVNLTLSSHGFPYFNSSTALENLLRNSFLISSWTIFKLFKFSNNKNYLGKLGLVFIGVYFVFGLT